MDLKRGDIVICATSGDHGKPRPAVVVQSNLFNPTHTSFTICPITTHLLETPMFRLPISPEKQNGLKLESQIMVDKLTTLHQDKIRQKIGTLSDKHLATLNTSLKIWLNLE